MCQPLCVLGCVVCVCVGRQAVALVREFLEFFQLDFTTAVFDPETNAVSQHTYTHNTYCEMINTNLALLALHLSACGMFIK